MSNESQPAMKDKEGQTKSNQPMQYREDPVREKRKDQEIKSGRSMPDNEDQEIEEQAVKTKENQPIWGKESQPTKGQPREDHPRGDQQMLHKGRWQMEVNKDSQMLHNWEQPTEDKESPQIKEMKE